MTTLKTYPIHCHVCGRDFNHTSEFLAGNEATSDGRLIATCNVADPNAHTREEIAASYARRHEVARDPS